jgi:hypothetical protein
MPLRVPTSQIMEFMKYVGDEHTLAFNSVKFLSILCCVFAWFVNFIQTTYVAFVI